MTNTPIWKMTADELEAYKHKKAELVMRALREGKTARAIFGSTNEIDKSTLFYKEYGRNPKRLHGPAIWTRDSVIAYKTRFPEWGMQFDKLAKANADAHVLDRGAWRRAITHCKNGHPLSGDNITFYSRKGRNDKFRRCKICQREREKNAHVSPEKARAVLSALHSGETIASITGGGKPTFILSHRAIMVLRRSDPRLEKLIVDLSSKNAKPRWLEAMRKRRVTVAAPALSHNMSVLDHISAAVPRYIPENDRQDIIADMWTAVAEDRLKPSDIASQAKTFIAAHRKMYQTTDRWGTKSLDAPAYFDSPTSLVETLSEDRALWR